MSILYNYTDLKKSQANLTKQAQEQPNERWHLVPLLKDVAEVLKVDAALEKQASTTNATFLDFYFIFFRGSMWPVMNKFLLGLPGVLKVPGNLKGNDGVYQFTVIMDNGQEFDVQCNVNPTPRGFASVEMTVETVEDRFHVNTQTVKFPDTSKVIAAKLGSLIHAKIIDIIAVTAESRRRG